MAGQGYRRVIKSGREVDVLMYDRDLSTTFNTYSEEEIIQYKTLMRHVGGCKVIAFELFKHENGYKETSKRKIIVKDKETGEIEEIWMPIKEVFFGREGVVIRSTYQHKVMLALNIHHKERNKSNNNTSLIVRFIDKMAEKRQRQKDKSNMNVSRWLVSKDDPLKKKFSDRDFAPIKKTLNLLNSGKDY